MSQPPEEPPPPDPFAPPGPAHAPAPVYGQPDYPWAPYAPAYGTSAAFATGAEPQPGTDGFAIAALVLGIVSIVPLAVIFGVVALRRIGRTHQGGKGMAIAGLAISGVWIVIAAAGFAVAAFGHVGRGSGGSIVTAGKVAAADLRVGDCIEFPSASTTTVKTFDAVPCSQPHDAEAYAGGTLPLTGDWPGESQVQQTTDQKCSDAFEPFVGVGIDATVLQVSYFYPEQDAWTQGDRGYICVVGSDVNKTTGTLKGAAR
jgi:hypothetical protein